MLQFCELFPEARVGLGNSYCMIHNIFVRQSLIQNYSEQACLSHPLFTKIFRMHFAVLTDPISVYPAKKESFLEKKLLGTP